MILQALYYFLPALIANMTPPLFKKLRLLKYPIDFNKTFRGKRMFGKSKTWRGLVLGTFCGMLIFFIQIQLYSIEWFRSISLVNYPQTTFWLGFLLSFGALFGDIVESFFKRQSGRDSSHTWFPFDQIDFIIGALLLSFLIFIPSWEIILMLFVISTLLSLLFHYLGYVLGVNKEKI